MPKIYYKVVNKNLQSAVANNYWNRTQYKLGEWVSPPNTNTPLCVFDSIDAAKDFRSCKVTWHNYRIFKCKIKTKFKRPWRPMGVYSHFMKLIRLINRHAAYIDSNYVITTLPPGTVCCKQVKLLEEVEQ